MSFVCLSTLASCLYFVGLTIENRRRSNLKEDSEGGSVDSGKDSYAYLT